MFEVLRSPQVTKALEIAREAKGFSIPRLTVPERLANIVKHPLTRGLAVGLVVGLVASATNPTLRR